MPIAEIIAIGTELLLGEIQDTNTAYLTRKLRDIGVDIYRATLIGDNEQRISSLIQEAAGRADIIITTGGLGPTVDDPTRQAVALAVGSPLKFHQELWEQIIHRFTRFNRQPTENNRKQAYIPEIAEAIVNPVGTAPAFLVETGKNVIISLPGVPREMETIYEASIAPFLTHRYQLKGVIKVRVLHLAGVGESTIDEWVADYETITNPTVGLAARAGQIDVRITAKAGSPEIASQMIQEFEDRLRERLGEHVYGADDETLEGVILRKMRDSSFKLAIIETTPHSVLLDRLHNARFDAEDILIHEAICNPQDVEKEIAAVKQQKNPDVILSTELEVGKYRHILHLKLVVGEEEMRLERFFGGPPSDAPAWSGTTALDALRRAISKTSLLTTG